MKQLRINPLKLAFDHTQLGKETWRVADRGDCFSQVSSLGLQLLSAILEKLHPTRRSLCLFL
ncbi:MAG: hypothetical protein HUU41_17975 [Bryobacteraceae bacterium]|nr:hypothetical protein [Bryobacterales bacterium]MEB2363798.1 hypothetical protein [Bryobacterales bacterium]NUN03000.1 hypothetical protein [Bryobacteraceae bacterium]